MSGKLTPLGWSLLIIAILCLTIVGQCFRLDAVTSDAYHWRNVAAARDTLVQDAQGRAHRAGVELSSVREMYAVLRESSQEQYAEIKRLRAHVQSVTTITVQAPPETLYVPSGDTVYTESVPSYAIGIQSYVFDFEGATVKVTPDSNYSFLSATISYKPLSVLATISRMKDDTWRTDVQVNPAVYEITGINTVVLSEKPGYFSRFWARIRFPLVFAAGVYTGAKLFR